MIETGAPSSTGSALALKDVCSFIRGVGFQKHEVRSSPAPGHLPILRAGNIQGKLDAVNDLVWVPKERVSDEQRMRPGDIAICLSSGSPLVVGKTAQLQGPFDGSVGAFCGIIRPRDSVSARYLGYWFRSAAYLRWRNSQARGANIQNLRFSNLESLTIPWPSLPEQKRITLILTEQMAAVERARAAVGTQLEAAKALGRSLSRETFSPVATSRWITKSLGEISAVSGGIQKTPDRAPHKFHRPFLTVRNVQRGFLDLSVVERFEVTPEELTRYRLERGDILIVEGNGSRNHIGRNAIFQGEPDDCIHQNHIIRVRVDHRVTSAEFVSVFLNSGRGAAQLLEKAKTTTGLYTLSVSKIEQLEIPLPPLDEQIRIIEQTREVATSIEKVEQAVRERLDAIEALPATLLLKAFRGRD